MIPTMHHAFDNIVAVGEHMRNVLAAASRAAPTDASVFISGQAGTGKELLATAIHASSRRSEGPFVTIHCAALPDFLIERELFGTGDDSVAVDGERPTRLEAASGGTFFLDEITEMEMGMQARLLRAIQDGRITSGAGEIPLDVRWIAGTTRDPEEAVREGVLSRDLLARLSDLLVHLPPLRERREDIPALAGHFLRRYAQRYERGDLRLGDDALGVLSGLKWGGNVRELENVMEYIVSKSAPGQEIAARDLPEL